jgi:uncharacterized membrane protein
MDFLQSIFRWIHVVAGITWIGLLYFFNFVNSAFVPTMDGETKKKVVPELMPRALYWFRWGAAFTWITGVLLLLLVFYSNSQMLFEVGRDWSAGAVIMLAVVFGGVVVYDQLYKVLKDPTLGFVVGVVLSAVAILLLDFLAGFSFRGYTIHLGAMFGTFMAFNVWFRIWPAQQKIITATKNGQAPDPALGAMAGLRSKHNTYMSVPLVFAMLNAHDTWAASSPIILCLIVPIGWGAVYWLYAKAPQVKGF